MSPNQSVIRRSLSVLAAVGCLATGLSTVALAQNLPGLVIFSGVDRDNQLGYRMDYGGVPTQRDRYRLRIPASKMTLAVSEFAISYPVSYEGTFDADDVRVEVEDEVVELDEVTWDEENRLIKIYPLEPVPSGTSVELVLSDVRNPRDSGMHYFNCLVMSPGDTTALLRYVGTWIISIGD